DGSRLYIGSPVEHRVWVIDPNGVAGPRFFTVPRQAWGVAVSPDGKTLWVSADSDGQGGGKEVYVIDAATGALRRTITLAHKAQSVTLTPDGRRAYLTTGDTTVYAIDTATFAVRAIDVGRRTFTLAITPDGRRGYVTSSKPENTVTIFDTN
ncbi:MAG: hypothetical protein QOK10_1396, partial [Pseudonocardiales bacterium]|nr:hypothetical protein [Pseudonocardiales bacterium]